MIAANNKTLFGDWGAERTALVIAWRGTILVLSLVGNITIMFAVTKYHAIKLGRITTSFIGHLAVSDLGLTLFGILPVLTFSLVTASGSDYINGVTCAAVCFTCTLFISSSVLLVCMLNLCKLATMLFPLRSRGWSANLAHISAGISWGWSSLSAVYYVGINSETVYYDHRIGCCMVTTVSPKQKWFRITKLFVGIGLPGVLVILTTLRLLHFAQRQARTHMRNSLQFQSAVTAISIAFAYCLSYLPFFAYLTITYFMVDNKQFDIILPEKGLGERTMIIEYDKSGQPMNGFFYKDFYLLACLFTFLNSGINFFIYVASITSFRQFVQRKLCLLFLGKSDAVPLSARQNLLRRDLEKALSFNGVLGQDVDVHDTGITISNDTFSRSD